MATKSKGPLSYNRIQTIMRSCSEAGNISKEAIALMAKSTELFIKLLASEGIRIANNEKKLSYKDLAEVVGRDEKYEFLREIMPKKITYAEYKMLQND